MDTKRRRFSAGIIPIRFVDAGPTLLLLRAYRLWDFPKGEVEPGEEPMNCARRELAEETTLVDPTFLRNGAFWETAPYAHGKVARYYLARCDSGDVWLPINPDLGAPEHHEFRWVTLDDLHALLPKRLRPLIPWLREQLEIEGLAGSG